MLVITCFHFYRLPLWQNVPICATSAPFLIVSLHANSSGLEVSSKHVHWPLKFWAWCVFSSSLIYYMLLQVHTAHKNNTLHTRIIESWTVCIHFQWNRFEWLPVGLLGRTHETPCKCWPANLHRRSSHWSARGTNWSSCALISALSAGFLTLKMAIDTPHIRAERVRLRRLRLRYEAALATWQMLLITSHLAPCLSCIVLMMSRRLKPPKTPWAWWWVEMVMRCVVAHQWISN